MVHMVQKLIDARDLVGLKAILQQYIQNALYPLRFGLHKMFSLIVGLSLYVFRPLIWHSNSTILLATLKKPCPTNEHLNV